MSDREPFLVLSGLGNPGSGYAKTRHNVGFWLVDELASRYGGSWSPQKRHHCDVASITLSGHTVTLIKPHQYMNENGRSIASYCRYLRIPPNRMIVAYDDLDYPPGIIKCREDGGDGGHRGLKSVIQSFGNCKNFVRLRIGIGHPGDKSLVHSYVLHAPNNGDRSAIELAINHCADHLDTLIEGEVSLFMNHLHTS